VQLPYHTFIDTQNSAPGPVRLHRFLTGREAGGVKPVFGLTAAIMIRVAAIGYRRRPDFKLDAEDQPSVNERAVYALKHRPEVREAATREGIDVDRVRTPARRIRRKRRSGMKAML